MNESPIIESSLTPAATSPLETLARQWMLRILVLQKGYRHFVGVDGYENNTIAQYLGLETCFEGDAAYSPNDALVRLRALHTALESHGEIALPPTLQRNLDSSPRCWD